MTNLEQKNLDVLVLTCCRLGFPNNCRLRQRLGFWLSLGGALGLAALEGGGECRVKLSPWRSRLSPWTALKGDAWGGDSCHWKELWLGKGQFYVWGDPYRQLTAEGCLLVSSQQLRKSFLHLSTPEGTSGWHLQCHPHQTHYIRKGALGSYKILKHFTL